MRDSVSMSRSARALPVGALFFLAMTVHAASAPPAVRVLEPESIEVDLGSLPASERAALVPILRAARQMDALYMQQVWPGTREFISRRDAPQTPVSQAEATALEFYKGPWEKGGAAFIAGVPAKRPIGDFYPEGASKSDIDAWLATLTEPERKRALGSFTAIERGQDGRFSAVPYSVHYKDGLVRVASALREAASLTHEETLKKYLTLRAQALLDDNYYASDVAFVGLKGPIDVVLGPYEVDDDGWFGVKTGFTASIAIVNQPATQRISRISSHLQELENHLPLASELRGRKLGGAAPVVVLDVIYHGGMAGAGGLQAGYGLPNDLHVLDAVGARTGTYSNVLEQRYESTFKPIADAVLADADKSKLRFEDIRDEIMFVRMFDSMGPQFVTGTRQPIAETLRESGSVAGQIRSMLLSLWGHRYLIQHGYLDQREEASLYSAFLVPALARARGGISSPASRGSTYVLNHLLEAGAISPDANGRLKIDTAKADADIEQAAREFIAPMAKGDATSVKALLKHYVVVTPQVRGILARMGPSPSQHRPVYTTADRVSPVRDK